jgi:hypothetical protein
MWADFPETNWHFCGAPNLLSRAGVDIYQFESLHVVNATRTCNVSSKQ